MKRSFPRKAPFLSGWILIDCDRGVQNHAKRNVSDYPFASMAARAAFL